MALVRKLEPGSKQRLSPHEEVDCFYFEFSDRKGNRYLQLDTLGRPTRKLAGKVSQSLQFDREALIELRRIIDALVGGDT
jgi:hypothetical protein